MNRSYLAAVSTTVGTVVGGGILALPYAVSKTGILSGLLLFVVIGTAGILITAYTGELSSRFRRFHQIPVMVSEYAGNRYRPLVMLFQLVTIYGAQIAYLAGIGSALVFLFGMPFVTAVAAVFLLSLPIIYKGASGVEKAEIPLTAIKLLLIVAVSVIVLTSLNVSNLAKSNPSQILQPFGVILFSLTGYTIIPEVKQELGKRIKDLTRVIVASYVISISVYALFTIAFIGAFGPSVASIATNTIGSHDYHVLFAVATIFLLITPYLTLSIALSDAFSFDFKFRKYRAAAAALLFPFIVALLEPNFEKILEVTGGVFLSILSILILIAVRDARIRDGVPSYSAPKSRALMVFTAAVMIAGLVYTVIIIL